MSENYQPSTKITKLIETLHSLKEADKGTNHTTKSLVFSQVSFGNLILTSLYFSFFYFCLSFLMSLFQFTTFLDIIGVALEREGIKFVRVDGTLASQQRQKRLDEFSSKRSMYTPRVRGVRGV